MREVVRELQARTATDQRPRASRLPFGSTGFNTNCQHIHQPEPHSYGDDTRQLKAPRTSTGSLGFRSDNNTLAYLPPSSLVAHSRFVCPINKPSTDGTGTSALEQCHIGHANFSFAHRDTQCRAQRRDRWADHRSPFPRSCSPSRTTAEQEILRRGE